MAIKINNNTVIDNSKNVDCGILTATSINVPPSYIGFSPADGSTDQERTPTITLTLDSSVNKGTSGNITLRSGSAGGTILETISVSSAGVVVSGNTVTFTPTTSLPTSTNVYVVIDSGAFLNVFGNASPLLNTYNFTTKSQILYTIFGLGRGNNGRLDNNNTTSVSSPVQIPGNNWVADGLVQDAHSFNVTGSNQLYVFGINSKGQLGQGDLTPYSSPVQVPGNQWAFTDGVSYNYKVGGAWSAMMAIKTDGTLWAWGDNFYGQLGQNNRTQYSSPVQIPGNQWNLVSSNSFESSFAIKTDGTLWAWGSNQGGVLGQGNTTFQSSPVQVPGNQWAWISNSARDHKLAIKTDGTLWAWGSGSSGALGQSSQSQSFTPLQIPGNQWKYADGNTSSSVAIKTDGTLWVWGDNNAPRFHLGQGNSTPRSSPVQLPGNQWEYIFCGTYTNYAIKTDGSLWAWGTNNYAQLGQGNFTQYSSPIQIPGNQWSWASRATRFSTFLKKES